MAGVVPTGQSEKFPESQMDITRGATRRKKDPANPPVVSIYGAGVAGLTVAHELIERGFIVQVLEPADSLELEGECEVGGMARSQSGRVPVAVGLLHPNLEDQPSRQELSLGALFDCLRSNLTPTQRPARVPFRVRCKAAHDGWSDSLPAGIGETDAVPNFQSEEDWADGPWLPEDLWKIPVVADTLACSLHDYRAHFLAQILRLEAKGWLRKEAGPVTFADECRKKLQAMLNAEQHTIAEHRAAHAGTPPPPDIEQEPRSPWDPAKVLNILGYRVVDSGDRGSPDAGGRRERRTAAIRKKKSNTLWDAGFSAKPSKSARNQAIEHDNSIDSLTLRGFDERPHEGLILEEPFSFLRDASEPVSGETFKQLIAMLDREILWVKVFGHTDTDGRPEDCRDTSARHARATVEALVALQPTLKPHLSPAGVGAYYPIDTNATAAGRTRNNRVDFEVIESLLPGEHGYRFFPAHYRHLRDTMERIPIYAPDGRESLDTVHDNLLPTTNQGVAMRGGDKPVEVLRGRPESFAEFRELFVEWRKAMKITDKDLTRFQYSLFKYLTTADERREAELEDESWWDYIQGDDLSEGMQLQVRAMAQALVAFNAKEADARTYGNIALQLMMDQFSTGEFVDMTLNGPTSDVWLRPWKRYLQQHGVRFFLGSLDGIVTHPSDPTQLVPIVTPTRQGRGGACQSLYQTWTALSPEGSERPVAEPTQALVALFEALKQAKVTPFAGPGPAADPRADGLADHDPQLAWSLPSPDCSQELVWLDESHSVPALRPDFHVLALPLPRAKAILGALEADPTGDKALRPALKERGFDFDLKRSDEDPTTVQLEGDLAQFQEWMRSSVTFRDDDDETVTRPLVWEPPTVERKDTEPTKFSHQPMRHMVGIQYYFNTNFRIGDGHIYFPESDWALSSISQPTFWRFRPTAAAGYLGLLSVDICDWNAPYELENPEEDQAPKGEMAWRNSCQDIAEVTWSQIKAGLDQTVAQDVVPPQHYHLDVNIRCDEHGRPQSNESPFLAATVGLWKNRPGRCWAADTDKMQTVAYSVSHKRWVMAGTHMVTHTRMTTMEAANETGRHTVRAILKHLKASVPNSPDKINYNGAGKRLGMDPEIWDPEQNEFPDLAFLKGIDSRLFKRGVETQLLTLLGADDWLEHHLAGIDLAEKGMRWHEDVLEHMEEGERHLRNLDLDDLTKLGEEAREHVREASPSVDQDPRTWHFERMEDRLGNLLADKRLETEIDYVGRVLRWLLEGKGDPPRRDQGPK